jgi:hypothetical protein
MKAQPVQEDHPHGNQKMFHVVKSANPETEAAAVAIREAANLRARPRVAHLRHVRIRRQGNRAPRRAGEIVVEEAAAEATGQAGRVDRVVAGSSE